MTFLSFVKESITAKLISPSGDEVEKIIEIRTHPITGRTCRVALSRMGQSEPGTDVFPEPPPYADCFVIAAITSGRCYRMTPRPFIWPLRKTICHRPADP